jgi:hypothetical protein
MEEDIYQVCAYRKCKRKFVPNKHGQQYHTLSCKRQELYERDKDKKRVSNAELQVQ